MSYPELHDVKTVIKAHGPDHVMATRIAEDLAPVIAAVEARSRLPRPVTTVEELDALPVGSIVLVTSGRRPTADIFQKFYTGSRAWVEMDPSDREDGQNILESVVLLASYRGEEVTVTAIFEPAV